MSFSLRWRWTMNHKTEHPQFLAKQIYVLGQVSKRETKTDMVQTNRKVMNRIGIIIVLLTVLINSILAINDSHEFKLNGTINLDSGTVCLIYVGNERYYPKELINPTSKIVEGKFIFKGIIQYPYAFRLGVKQFDKLKYVSDIFYVDPVEQNLQCDINTRQVPVLNNRSMNELMTYNYFADNNGNDKTPLFNYAKSHPSSYIVLWKLIDEFSDKNHIKNSDSIYHCLSKKLKSTYTGKELAKYLLTTKSLEMGSDFPELKVNDMGKQIDFDVKSVLSQYILIDFWYSSCGPCIGQFENFKKIYSLFEKRGFNIIGIANEKEETIEKWRNVISKHLLPWKQYIDMNGFECNNLNINSFPSNFLINKEGKVVAMNLDPKDLNDFLEEHLK